MRAHDPELCDYLVMELIDNGNVWDAMFAELEDDDDDEMVPLPLPNFPADEHDTGPLGFTIVGPLLPPRKPARKPRHLRSLP